jgi:hypothetical protein
MPLLATTSQNPSIPDYLIAGVLTVIIIAVIFSLLWLFGRYVLRPIGRSIFGAGTPGPHHLIDVPLPHHEAWGACIYCGKESTGDGGICPKRNGWE